MDVLLYTVICKINFLWEFTYYHSDVLNVRFFTMLYSAGNKTLNPGSHRDQIIPLFGGYFKFRAISWYMRKNPVGHHGSETKKILQFRSSNTTFLAIFHNTLFKI